MLSSSSVVLRFLKLRIDLWGLLGFVILGSPERLSVLTVESKDTLGLWFTIFMFLACCGCGCKSMYSVLAQFG